MSHSVIISAVLLLMGVYLLVAYSMIADGIKDLAPTSNAQRANQGIFTLGITFIVTGITFGLCNWKCNCGDLSASGTVYLGFFLILGLVLTSLAGVLVSNVKGPGKKWAVGTLVIGVLFIVFCIAVLAYMHKDTIMSTVGGKSSGKSLAFAFY
jgi:hypothetical protein